MKAFQRMLMRYLRNRGWVVFWLDEGVRQCHPPKGDDRGTCWVGLYEQERLAGRI